MSIIRKFKDFFNKKPKVGFFSESEFEKSNRLHQEIVNKLKYVQEEISYLFTDFEDLGASITISPVYKTEKTFTNGSRLVRPEDSTEVVTTHIGYVRIKIEFGQMNIEEIDDNFPDTIRRCLIESIFRMDDSEETKAKSADYISQWTNTGYGSPKRQDIILLKFFDGTAEEYLTKNWGRDYFRVKMWTKKDSDKILGLNNMTINIYTKPIEVR